jgi:type II secretory pathway component PulF
MTKPSPQNIPNADLAPRSTALMIACWLLTVVLVFFAIMAPIAIGSFEQVFTSFGADLPVMTVLFLQGRYFGVLLAIAALVMALLVTSQSQHKKAMQKKMTIGFVALFLLSFILYSAGFIAMYLPIFKMGQVV